MKKIILIILVLLLGGCVEEANTEVEAIDIKKEVSKQETETPVIHIEKDKQENVYSEADAYGNIINTEVEVILKANDEDVIADVSNLTDIRNTQSDEQFTYEDGVLIFENKGEDIHYKGNSTRQLPIRFTITYYLDGKEIRAEDLAGKSGRVKIRFDYVNTTRKQANGITTIAPFMAVSMVMLDPDRFYNIEIENGRLMEFGDSKAAMILAVPGLKNALRLEGYELTKDIEIDDYAWIEADVRDFSLDYTVTILSNGLFRELEDEDLNDLLDFARDTEEFKSDAQELTDNTRKLYDASIELRDGMGDALDDMSEGVQALAQGSRQLNEAIGSFSQLEQIQAILNDLNESGQQIEAKVESIEDEQTSTALKALVELIGRDASQGAAVLSQPDETVAAYLQADPEFAGQLSNYLSLNVFAQMLNGISAGSTQLKNGLEQFASADADEIDDLLDELVSAAKEFDDGMNEFVNDDLNDFLKLGGSSLRNVVNAAKALKILDEEYGCFSGLGEGKSGSTSFVIETEEIK